MSHGGERDEYSGLRHTPARELKVFDVVMFIGDGREHRRRFKRGEKYIVMRCGRGTSSIAVTSETLNGWRVNESHGDDEGYVMARSKGWNGWNISCRNFTKVGGSSDGVMISGVSVCFDCRFDCKNWDLENCPLYEEKVK